MTYIFHILIMEKKEIDGFFGLNGDIWRDILQKYLLMLRLHLPRAPHDLFVYDFSYGFQVS